jgi:hypothetical protein
LAEDLVQAKGIPTIFKTGNLKEDALGWDYDEVAVTLDGGIDSTKEHKIELVSVRSKPIHTLARNLNLIIYLVLTSICIFLCSHLKTRR